MPGGRPLSCRSHQRTERATSTTAYLTTMHLGLLQHLGCAGVCARCDQYGGRGRCMRVVCL